MSKIWFKRKTFGWGWVPSSWEGWLVTLIYAAIFAYFFVKVDRRAHSGSDALIAFSVPFIILTTVLIIICYKKGEKPKWIWRKEAKNNAA